PGRPIGRRAGFGSTYRRTPGAGVACKVMSVLAPGLLVASPPPGDPNFDRSVVLLAAHGPEGAFGWIINGPELMTLPELLVRAEITEQAIEASGSVRVGGPVSREQVWLVYKSEDRFDDIDGQFEVGNGIV